MVAWWSQAKPVGGLDTPFAMQQLWSDWLPATGPKFRLPVAADTPRTDTTRYRPSQRPRVAPQDRVGTPFSPQRRRSPLVLPLPSNVQLDVQADDSLKNFDVREKLGSDLDFRDPSRMTFEEYSRWQQQQAVRSYFRQRAAGGVAGDANTPPTQRLIPKIYLGPMADRIFGGSYVDIRPQGAVTLRMGARFNRNENPTLTLRQQRVGDFQYDQNLNLNLTGQIGEKLRLTFNYDTRAAFDFENNMKLDYTGYETDIIRKVELGNVSLPLNNSLITGGQNLFGVKAQFQFGRLGVTTIASTLRGQADEIRIQNGGQSRQFELKASQYERDRHYFISQAFRDRYDAALRNLPTVQSGVEITNLEVYVTNDNRQSDNLRNVVTLMDLGEPKRLYRQRFQKPAGPNAQADNNANTLFSQVQAGGTAARSELGVDDYLSGTLDLQRNVDYEHIRARKLDPREYTYNAQLGYISLNTQLLPEQVLGVSYQYITNGKQTPNQVGELVKDYGSRNQDEVIFLKMLKATNPGVGLADPSQNPSNENLLTRNLPTWDLMMKNIYPLNASQLNRDNFQLQIIYKDDVTGVDLISLKEGQRIANRPLIEVLNLDNVNPNNDRNPDGNFDFFPGITIDTELGKIIFPEVQPFGNYLAAQFDTATSTTERELARRYVYRELYTQVQSDAQQRQEKDKFFLRGRFQATSTDEINLPGIGIAEGSVRVRAGSTLLQEGVDYQVFYDQAKVKILNPSYLNSANELRVEFEKNALVQVQPRKLLGARFDYRVSPDLNFGATVLHLRENQAPGINRVNIGDEPGNNTIYGFDVNMRRESRALTKYLDMLPLISTKEISSVAFSGEFAQLLPGQSKLGNDESGGENGVSYLDDFENARTPYTLGGINSATTWRLAATPAPLGGTVQGLEAGYRRAKLAWYTVDQTYYTNGQSKPQNIGVGDLKNHYVRGIKRTEIFPNRDVGTTGNSFETTFDLAYFPEERGQYNYTPNVDPSDPRRFSAAANSAAARRARYGGISREITFDTDFDNANVEYLEFWMMDPFIQSTKDNNVIDDGRTQTRASDNTTGGDLYINLGSVSEDVLKDNNRYEFENGLPVDEANLTQDTNPTPYGRVSRQPFLTDAFNATPGARARQDVGLDGVNDAEERTLTGAPAVYGSVPDPAADNFRHHLDPSYDQADAKILARYKDFNGLEGNSPEGSQLSSTPFPDKEDLNRDNVLTDTERYYEYRMQLRPDQMQVGQNFIVDKITNKISDSDGDEVSWYQFRIPVRQPTGVVGAIQGQDFGFKSIRFLRMYLTQWDRPVVLRLVQPQFVANQWRRYLTKIADPTQVIIGPDTDADAFNISTVSIEENGPATTVGTDAIPYVLPPNIRRDREYGSSTVNRQQNEQSLRLVVEGLRDGFAKAAYKNVSLSLLRYKKLKLFLHAEDPSGTTRDEQLRGFVRIGTDYTQNYYEYSRPLILTKPGQSKVEEVWPEANRIDLRLQDFIDAKARRNQQALNSADYTKPFVVTLPDKSTITIVGNPDLSAVQGAMIGILNPRDDNASKNLTLWADELRVSEFDTENGWAATARFNAKLADIANITATGSYVTTGFGSLQDRAQQRSLDNIARGDVNATVAAEKFFPEKLGLRVPVLLQAGMESRAPKYDPLDPDTKLTQSLEKFDSNEEKAAYRREVVDQTSQRSISLLNVRKERTNPEKKVRPYDIENFALSYSLTERLHTDVRTDRDYTRTYTGALAYVYQTTPRNYTPLAKVKAFDSPYLKMLQEVNFTPLPSRFSFRADLDRRYNERFLQRTLEPGQVPVTDGIPGVFQKSFFFNRIYDLRWDLTKALALDYTATNRAVVDEGAGRSIGDDAVAQQNRELLRRNLLRGGRTTNFNQTVAVTYRLPLDKFPLTDWLSADARYAANYTWQAASTALRAPLHPGNPADTTTGRLNLGNTIQNNGELSANGRIDLVKLYNKVRFLNIINNAPPPQPRAQAGADNPRDARAGLARRVQNGTPGAPDATAAADSSQGPQLRALKAVLRSLMTARSLNFTYTRSNGTLLPGYLPGTRFFGLNSSFDAPGVPFVLGRQYDLDGLYERAYRRGWYTDSSQYLNTPLSSLLTEALTLRTTLEPFRDFTIQLDARRNLVRNREVFYRLQVDTVTLTPIPGLAPQSSNALGSGTFSTSFISIQTLFGDLSNRGETSRAFQRFIDNRVFVQERLAADNQNVDQTNGRRGTYSYNSQDVLLPAFLDAYRGKSSGGYKSKKFNPFAVLPIPNWNIAYNGLAELPFMQRYFRSITLSHVYNSSYNINGYTTNASYNREPGGLPDRVNLSNNQYVPYYIIGQVTIAERLAPLIGLRFQTTGRLTGNLEYRIDRNIGLNTTNAQVTELHSTEMIIGAGFATNRLKLPFRFGGEQRVLRNELNARLDLSIRDNFTIQRTILDVVDPGGTAPTSRGRASSQVTNGTRQVQLRPTVDYVLNQRLNLQFFFTQNITAPRVQNAFRNTATEGGVQLRYSLSQ
ncbi:cell surface protein SprA [Hymenobacter sp. HSC-4F20]|nr:cell surface protein SprA [Hymenobacter sp. HSC-4F20]